MRNALVNWLVEKAKINKNIILVTGDLGYSVLEPYIDLHRSRYLNVGVAEQNMTGISAGLALEGLRPYNYSIGIFPTFRCAEQIRNDIDYHNLPVVICAIGSGVAYGNLGYSHHAIQDIALMRSMPNMLIGTPSDPQQVLDILDYQLANPRPLYLRLHKAGEKKLINNGEKVIPGQLKRIVIRDIERAEDQNKTISILCIGHIAARVTELCSVKGISKYPIFTVPLWNSSSSSYLAKQISKYKTIVTVEDHVLEGGFGSFILEVIAKYKLKTNVIPITLKRDVVGKVAKEETILQSLMQNLKYELIELSKHK